MTPDKLSVAQKRHCVALLVAGRPVETIARAYGISVPEMAKALQKWAVEAEKGNLE